MTAIDLPQSGRVAVLVLGMHRSGTSALSGVLARLGVREPKTLMPPTKDNLRGYGESTLIAQFNDEVLRSSGSRWKDWEPFNRNWIHSPEATQYLQQMNDLVDKEFGRANLLLIKDPRICRVVPLWVLGLRMMVIDPRFVLAIRHPIEVAQSLKTRDGITVASSLLIWMRHVLDAEAETRSLPRAVVPYERLINDWQGEMARVSRQIACEWPKGSSAVEIDVENFLSSELRHHRVGPDDVSPQAGSTLDLACTVYHSLKALTDGDPVSAHKAQSVLDEIRARLDRDAPIYAAAVREFENKLEAESARARSIENELAAAKNDLVAQSAKRAVLEGKIADLDSGRSSALMKMQSAEQSAVALNERIVDLEKHREQLEQKLRQEKEREGALRTQMAEADSLNTELRSAAAVLRTNLSQSEDAVGRLRASNQARTSEIVILTKLLIKHQHDLENSSIALSDACQKLASASEDRRALEESYLAAIRSAAYFTDQVRALEVRLSDIIQSRTWRWANRIKRVLLFWRAPPRADDTDVNIVTTSPFFDSAWYLDKYQDVAQANVNPAEHYVRFGASELRDPGPRFSTGAYLASNRDVAESCMNPLVHYMTRGQLEGRPLTAIAAKGQSAPM